MREIKVLILKTLVEFFYGKSTTKSIAHIRRWLYWSFNKLYSYNYVQRMIQELVREGFMSRYVWFARGYAHYDITKKGHNFLENLEEKEEE